jgi:ATP-dependent DNA helicase RecG
MVTLDTLENWLKAPVETEHLEFKEAKTDFAKERLLKYCNALANERGGYLVLGVTNSLLRSVTGTLAFSSPEAINHIKSHIFTHLQFRVEIYEIAHSSGRVVVFDVPSRPQGRPRALDGQYWMRVGEELRLMSTDQLARIFSEGEIDWLERPAKFAVSAESVITLLDSQIYFDLIGQPYPTNRDAVLDVFLKERLIAQDPAGWQITNLAALLLAKDLRTFSVELARKAPRFVLYEGTSKLTTKTEQPGTRGYATGFKGLLEFVHAAAPRNLYIEQTLREETKMFPKQALRELIANALVHQDFSISGASVMIEMFSDRIEISNPGRPLIELDRFINEYRSRNERLADFMRRFGLCEEKSSGIDKVVQAAEDFQLPAPDFEATSVRTTAILFAHQEFSDMNKSDRIRACYQHCCLLYVDRKQMSNQSLRKRFGLSDEQAAVASQVIAATKAAGRIKADESDSLSTRYARYLPYWA